MKKINILILFCIMVLTSCMSYKTFKGKAMGCSINEFAYICTIEYRMVQGDTKWVAPLSEKRLKKIFKFYFCISGNVFNDDIADNDYKEMKELLSKQELSKLKNHHLVAHVQINYKYKQKIELIFCRNGDYYYKGKWYKRNDKLYYGLFKYFTNSVLNNNTNKKVLDKMQNK